jgi:glycosyltransferase involved in cell wall biosynthesis
MKKTPAVFTWHEVWNDYWFEYLGKAGFFGRIIEKMVLKISGNNIAVSDWTKNRLKALGTPEEKIVVISNGIDIKRISEIEPEGSQGSTGVKTKIYDLIFVGRLIKEKNVNVLIKSIALLKNTFPHLRCCIVGDGPEKETLMELSKGLGLNRNIEFAGFQEYRALIGKIKASKLLVLPSSREGFGMVVIEAFACGIPVVTVKEKYNAAQGLVEEGVDGFVVELKDSEVAQGIERIIKDEAFYEKLSAMSFRKAGEYDWEKIVSELVLYYSHLEVYRERVTLI